MNHEDKNISIDLYGDGIGKVQLIQSMGSDATVVRSARVSFGNDEDGDVLNDRDKKLIRYLIKHRHTSTLEHCNITFKCVVPLFIRSQHHRHRTWSFNEESNRYKDLTKEENKPRFYQPDFFRTQHASNRQASNTNELINPWIDEPDQWVKGRRASDVIKDLHEEAVLTYNQLIKAGVCREQARGVLPQNLYTSYYASCNLNNLIKFIDLRSHEGAQWEIVRVANAMQEIAEQLYPETMKAYKEIKDAKNS